MACFRRNRVHDTWLTYRFTQTTLGRVGPPTPPGWTRAEIREGTRKPHSSTKAELMHIDRANQITVALEAADAADPVSVPGLVAVPTARTLARCSAFRASEARDVSRFRFVDEIVDVLPIFPKGHALVVMPAMVSFADTMRIANKEGSDPLFDAKVDDSPGGFVTLVTDTPGISLADCIPGPFRQAQRHRNWRKRVCGSHCCCCHGL
jgi:hypothetical protein